MIQPGLRELFGTTRPVIMATGSATALIEAGIRAGVVDRALCVVSGLFGERMADVVERCGKEAVRLHVPRGGVLELDLLEKMLDGPHFDAVTMVHSETSTGAAAPVGELLARLHQLDDVVTIVDAVSSLGGMPVEADRWNVDFIMTGSQKALGTPPGLAFAVASDRLLKRAADAEALGFYLNVLDLQRAAVESHFPQTPALPVVYALDTQLERIAREGLPARFARHRAMRERVEHWVAKHGRCQIWAPPGRRTDTVTALQLAPGRSSRAIVEELATLGWQIATGLLEEEDHVIRIGHMGDLLPEQLDPLFDALEPLL